MILYYEGKSCFLTNLLLEYDLHFEGDGEEVAGIYYVYREEDANMAILRKEFSQKKYSKMDIKFSKKLDENLISNIPKNIILICDDYEYEIVRSKTLQSMMYSAATVYAHHRQLWIFFVCQSVSVLKKNHKLNEIISQASDYIIFRNLTEHRSICRFLNNFSIKLKDGLRLSDVYSRYIQLKQFAYIYVSVSPRANQCTAYSDILMSSEGCMISYHDSDTENE